MGIMATPHKHPRTGVYYFRMAVPKQLVPLIGKTEFKTSLKTKDFKEAKRVFGSHLEQAHKQIDLAKLKLSNSPSVELTDYDCAIIAERWYERTREEIDSTGDYDSFLTYERYFTDDGQERVHQFGLSDSLEFRGMDAEAATGEEYQELVQALEGYIQAQLDLEGLVIPKDSSAFRKLIGAFYTYVRHIESVCEARHRRDFGYTAIKSPIVGQQLTIPKNLKVTTRRVQKSERSISSLFNLYFDSETLKGKDTKSLDEVKQLIRRFIEIVGDIDVGEVKRNHVVHFRDTSLQLPKSKAKTVRSLPLEAQVQMAKEEGLTTISSTTVNGTIGKISAVFGHAIELGWIDVNPLHGMKVVNRKQKIEADEGKGYTAEQISLLFKADTFNYSETPKPCGMACYWVPILCRYTGARVGEIVQLRKPDIGVSVDGIHFMNIRRGNGQSVKNDSSLRRVPIHDHLIELGFLDYVEDSSEFLFPELKPNKYGKCYSALGKWWRKQLRALEVETTQPFHSFRHSFRTQLRAQSVLDTVSDSITGHSPSNIGASYGTVELKTKKVA
ncbi:site-specific integrase [Vibrio sp. CyArs1]|uniref:site-specific integrase n=1 Tax=Vibrio sp. CyArs1 TaxID=2682577 RepID=UPI001F05B9C2|nr:site-specific integrase [Vibrio sp. CyArs1]